MRLSETAIQSFIDLYFKKYGVLLNAEEAIEIATRFARLIEVVESHELSARADDHE